MQHAAHSKLDACSSTDNGPVSRASQQCRCGYLSISEARRVCTGPIAVDLRAARLYLHPTRLVLLARHSSGAGDLAKRVTFADRLPEELGAGTPATEVEVHLSARSRPPLRCTRPCAALEVCSQSKGLVDGMQCPLSHYWDQNLIRWLRMQRRRTFGEDTVQKYKN